jgi:hypothetical protein
VTRAWKFLDAEGCSPFTRHRWQLPDGAGPGAWVDAGGPPEPCARGVHACTAAQLAYWLGPELWEVELEGEVREAGHKLVARRGRLLRRIAEWGTAAPEVALHSARRAREHAATVLTETGYPDLARRTRSAVTPEELAPLAAGASLDERSPAGMALGLAADAAHFAALGRTATTAYVAACAAGHAATATRGDADHYRRAFDAERRLQGGLIAALLGLEPATESASS